MNALNLKAVKTFAGMSHETHCYTASLYFRGVKVADVENAGHGGCDDERFVSKEARAIVYDYVKSLSTEFESDEAKAKEIRKRITSIVNIGGDDGYCENDTQMADSVLLADYADVLDIQWIQPSLDSICCDLVNDFLVQKDLKRMMSKRVLWTETERRGIIQTQCAPNKANKLRWIEQIGARDEVITVLNSIPFAEALVIFQENT